MADAKKITKKTTSTRSVPKASKLTRAKAVKKTVSSKAKKEAKPKVTKSASITKVVRYFETVGRRKTSVARVRLYPDKSNKIIVNDKDYKEYFPTEELRITANAPLRKTKLMEEFGVTVRVKGGGSTGQAEAVRHGIARALVKWDEGLRLRVKKSGYLKRDPREKERKKYGLKGARKAPQWSKR